MENLVLFSGLCRGKARRRCPLNPIKSLSKMMNTKTVADRATKLVSVLGATSGRIISG